jgi:hypothetical protein
VPPHEPEYQYQFAPVPKLPPEILIVAELPGQIGEVPEADAGSVDTVLTSIVVLTQVVELQIPSAKT